MRRPNEQRALIYARTDTDDGQMSWDAIEKQKHHCHRAITRLGARIVGEYVDVGEPGERINRPGLNLLLKDSEQRGIDVVVVSAMDRLAGRTEAISYLLLRLKELGANVLIAEDDALIELVLPSDIEALNQHHDRGGGDE